MNWYRNATNNDENIYGWPEMEIAQPTDEFHDLFWEWMKKGRKLQGMALHAQKMSDLLNKAVENDDYEKARMYASLIDDWRNEHSERVFIPDGGKKFEVNLFEDGSMW